MELERMHIAPTGPWEDEYILPGMAVNIFYLGYFFHIEIIDYKQTC